MESGACSRKSSGQRLDPNLQFWISDGLALDGLELPRQIWVYAFTLFVTPLFRMVRGFHGTGKFGTGSGRMIGSWIDRRDY